MTGRRTNWKHLRSLFVIIPVCLPVIAGAARSLYSSMTGFVLPDEAYYFAIALYGRFDAFYRDPRFLIYTLILKTGTTILGVRNVFDFLQLFPFFWSLWSAGSVIILFSILRCLDNREASLLTPSLIMAPVFMFLSATVLTEPVALFFVLLGIYCTLRGLLSGNWSWFLGSGISFTVGAILREPNLLFLMGNGLLVFFLVVKKQISRASVVAFLSSAALVAIATNSVGPLVGNISSSAASSGLPVFLPPESYGGRLASTNPWFILGRGVVNFVSGMTLGLNPIFFVALVGCFVLVAKQTFSHRTSPLADRAATLNSGIAILTVAVVSLIIGQWEYYAAPFALSAIFRYSYTSLPSLLVLRKLVGPRRQKRVLLCVYGLSLAFLALSAPMFVAVAQTNLSVEEVNRLKLDYRAPYYRLYLLTAHSGRTLVFANPYPRAYAFLAGRENVLLMPPFRNESELRGLLSSQSWDTVFLYGELYPAHYDLLNMEYPYYASVLRNQTSVQVHVVWVDGESYLFQMSPAVPQ